MLSSFSDLTEFAHKWISSTLSRAFFSAPIFRLQYSSTGPKMRESGTFNLQGTINACSSGIGISI